MELAQLASLVKSIAGVGVLVAVMYLAAQLRRQNQLARFGTRPSWGRGRGGELSGLNERLPDDLAVALAQPEPRGDLEERLPRPERESEDR